MIKLRFKLKNVHCFIIMICFISISYAKGLIISYFLSLQHLLRGFGLRCGLRVAGSIVASAELRALRAVAAGAGRCATGAHDVAGAVAPPGEGPGRAREDGEPRVDDLVGEVWIR